MFSLLNNGIVIKMSSNVQELKKIKKDNEVIIPSERHHDIGVDTYNYFFPTNKELIESGEIILEDNQIFIEEFDYIKTATDDEKVVVDRQGKKTIEPKTNLDKLIEGSITNEEFDRLAVEKRKIEYIELDKVRAEILDLVLLNLKDKNIIDEALYDRIDLLIDTRYRIKENNPKTSTLDIGNLEIKTKKVK